MGMPKGAKGWVSVGCAVPGSCGAAEGWGGSSCIMMKCPGSKHLTCSSSKGSKAWGSGGWFCSTSCGIYVLPESVWHLPGQSQLLEVGLQEQDPCSG